MKTKFLFLLCFILLHSSLCLPVCAQGTAFTYQGRLDEISGPANGSYDFKFQLFDDASGGTSQGGPVTNSAVSVSGGLFTVTLDFGNQFPGADRWLEVAARTNGTGAFGVLSPRQLLTATPYAIRAANFSGAVAASQLTGTIASNNIGAGSITSVMLADGAVNSGSLVDGSVTTADLDPTLLSNTFWRLGGNNGVNPAVDFVGTTDQAPLAFRAGNREVMRMEGQASGYRIIAGVNNAVSSATTNSAILGGRDGVIEANAPESTIVGGLDNAIRSNQRSAFIGGGARNEILLDNQHAVIVGGRDNRIGTNTLISLVVGGAENHIADNVDGGLMVGGFRNDILGSRNPSLRENAPILVGGSDNNIGLDSSFAVILGGDNSQILTNARFAVICGGSNNVAAGAFASVFGGTRNTAAGDYTVAMGRRAKANHDGSFVWADSQNADFASAGPNEFLIRAAGGVGIGTSPATALHVKDTGDTEISIESADAGSHRWTMQSSKVQGNVNTDGSFQIVDRDMNSSRLLIGTNGNVGIGTTAPAGKLHVNGTAGNNTGVWSNFSDRRLKDHIASMMAGSLDQLLRLEGVTYEYTRPELREGYGGLHRGWIAQQVEEVFPEWVSEAPDGMKMVTPVGFNALTVEALRELRTEKDSQFKKLEAENAELRQRLEKLERLFSQKDCGAK